MTPQQKLSKALIEQFSKIEERLAELEMKVSMIALHVNLIDYCDCHPIPSDKLIIYGMPCCPVCEKVIKKFITATL